MSTRPRHDCPFCAIAQGDQSACIYWESDDHMAFLSDRPNTPGVTVVIPRVHDESYAFAVDDAVLTSLVRASREVSLILDAAFADVGRTAMVFEGLGVNHLHAKLYPLHGTVMQAWRPIHSTVGTYTEVYPGYVASNDGPPADRAELAALAARLRNIAFTK